MAEVCLIESQIQNKYLSKAVKTYNRVTILNLNSMDPKEVVKQLKAEDYKRYFPQSNLDIGKSIL